MLLKSFFMLNSYNPNLPKEEWTLVKEIKTAGAYNESLGWGKYRIEISGGGGSGGASSATHSDYRNWANNGSAGELLLTIINVEHETYKTISGIIATGGQPSSAYAKIKFVGGTFTWDGYVSAGLGGNGYASGGQGSTKYGIEKGLGDGSAAAGGAGGGSSSLNIDGILTLVAKGGNGGAASADEIKEVSAGVGGSGGISSGTGAAGGAGAFGYKNPATSGAGANGYVRIYKSNIMP